MKLSFHVLWIRLSISEDYLERCENIYDGVLWKKLIHRCLVEPLIRLCIYKKTLILDDNKSNILKNSFTKALAALGSIQIMFTPILSETPCTAFVRMSI